MGRLNARQVVLKTGQQITVRSAGNLDAHAIVELMRSVVQEGPFTLTEPDEYDWTDRQKQQDIAEYTRQPGYLWLVAEVRDEVVGYLDFQNGHRHRTQHTGTLSIFIAQHWRGKGVGRALMQALIDWATAIPLIEKLTLAVFSTNERAIALYNSMGFQIEGRCPRDMKIAGTYVDSILMYRFVK